MTQAEALRALGIKKFVGCTYFATRSSTIFFLAISKMRASRCSGWRAWTLRLEKRVAYRPKRSTITSTGQNLIYGKNFRPLPLHVSAQSLQLMVTIIETGRRNKGGSVSYGSQGVLYGTRYYWLASITENEGKCHSGCIGETRMGRHIFGRLILTRVGRILH